MKLFMILFQIIHTWLASIREKQCGFNILRSSIIGRTYSPNYGVINVLKTIVYTDNCIYYSIIDSYTIAYYLY